MPPRKSKQPENTKREVIEECSDSCTEQDNCSDKGTVGRKRNAKSKNETLVMEFDKSSVALRAWEIWLSEGCPIGRDMEHWLRAERELSGASGSGSSH